MPGSYHLTTDFIIEIDGDRATQTWHILVYGRDPSINVGRHNFLRGVSHFEDTLVRTRDVWRLTSVSYG